MKIRLPGILFIAALLTLIVLILIPIIPIPATVHVDDGGAVGKLTVADSILWLDTDCTTVQWQVDNLSEIHFNDTGVTGSGEQSFCLDDADTFVFRITFANGDSAEYTLPLTVYLSQISVWIIALASTLVIGITLAWMGLTSNQTQMTLRQAFNVVLLSSLGVIVTLLLLEGTLRLWFNFGASREEYLRYAASAEEITRANTEFVPVPYVGYGLPSQRNGVNDQGFRNPPVTVPKPPDTYRILALGGSTTYGFGVEAGKDYPAQLQQQLREQYGFGQVELINAGVSRYRTLNSLVNLATRGLALEPDMIIIYHATNDTELRWSTTDCYNGNNQVRGIGEDNMFYPVVPPRHPSVLIRFVQIQLGLVPDPNSIQFLFQPSGLCDSSRTALTFTERLEANPPIYFERNLRSLIGIAQAHNLEILLVTQAYDRAYFDESTSNLIQSFAVAQEEHNAITRRLGAEINNITFYDFDAEFPVNRDLWFPDGVHLNEDGLRLQAGNVCCLDCRSRLH